MHILAAVLASLSMASAIGGSLRSTPNADNWAGYGRTDDQTHYSPLAEINVVTVAHLGLAWWFDIPGVWLTTSDTVTDQGYAGNDHALDREIASEVLDQSVSAWEHMLSVPELGGHAGSEILAKRPQFRGARMNEDRKQVVKAHGRGHLGS